MSAWKPAAAIVTLRRQVDARFPNRDTASDGIRASAAHTKRNPHSDHEPNARGYVLAVDIDADLDRRNPGAARQLADELVAYAASGQPGADRVKYVIFDDKLASGTHRRWWWRWRGQGYGHRHHIHVSFTEAAERDGRDFPLPILKVRPKPAKKAPAKKATARPARKA